MIKKIVHTGVFLFIGWGSHAQYFQFSQYNFTPQRINPATVANSNYARVSFDYRNQATGGGFNLSSNILNASYPFITSKGRRWAGIGVSFMDDRSGQAGIYNTQEAALSYALSVPISFGQSLSLGVKALYQTRKINMQGLYTGSQYIPDRGFDESLATGETSDLLQNNFMTFSAGLHWQEVDRKGNLLGYWGFSFFDFNKPEDSFLGSTSQLNSTFVASGGLLVYRKGNVSIFPEALYTRCASNNVLNIGAITSYAIKPLPNQVAARVDIITKYVVGRSAILGVQFHREKFAVGFSYDFPVIVKNESNTGAFEVGVELKRLVDPRKKTKPLVKNKNAPPKTIVAKKNVTRPDSIKTSVDSTNLAAGNAQPSKTMTDRLREKQDSVRTLASAGEIQHDPLILEKATLHFNFEFNSIALDEKATAYLDELAKALLDNPELKIKLVGHTDNVGSEKFNQRLSVYRAETLRDFLLAKGVPAGRVTAEGKGMKEPLNENKTEEDRARNRRVELTILY